MEDTELPLNREAAVLKHYQSGIAWLGFLSVAALFFVVVQWRVLETKTALDAALSEGLMRSPREGVAGTAGLAPSSVEGWHTYRNEEYGFEVRYPAFSSTPTVDSRKFDDGTGAFYFDVTSEPSDDFAISLRSNPDGRNLRQWFKENIDCNEILLNQGAYTEQDLSNGMSALVSSGPIPSEYTCDKMVYFPYAFAGTSSAQYVVSISLGQDHNLHLHGYDTAERRRELENQILSTLRFLK